MFKSQSKPAFAYIGHSKSVADRLRKIAAGEAAEFDQYLLKPGVEWPPVSPKHSAIFAHLSRRDDLASLEKTFARRPKGQRVIVIANELNQAEIRKLLRLGISDWISPDATDREVISATVQDRTSMREGARNIFAFTPVLGGMGATTLAIETAIILTDKGRSSTCVVDLDFYAGECADYLNIDAKLLLDGLSASPEDIDDHFLNSVMSEHSSGIMLLAAQTHLGSHQHIRAESVLHLLNLLSSRFENVIIDLPRSWYEWTDEVILGSDQLFLVTDASVPALRAAKRQIAEYRQRYAGKVIPKVLVNKQSRGWLSGGISENDLRETLENQFHGTISDDTATARQAINRGLPISSVKSRARLVQDLRKLIEPLLKK